MATKKTTTGTRSRKPAAKTASKTERVFAPRQRDETGRSNKHRVYVEYHRRVISDKPETAIDYAGIAAAANATGIKTTTIRSWIANWRSPNPGSGIPATMRATPLHAAAHGGDPAKMRAAIAAYDKLPALQPVAKPATEQPAK